MKSYLDIPPEEMIDVRFWDRLTTELGGARGGYWFIPGEHIHLHFKSDFGRPVVTVTAYSDFGIHEQEKSHPNMDLLKMCDRVDWEQAVNTRDGYAQVPIGPCCVPSQCKPTDKYSVKIDSFTTSTFPCLPTWVKKWFCVNLNVKLPNAQIIPFGLNDHGRGFGMLPEFRGRKKKSLLYVNFQDNTSERLQLKQYVKARLPWATFRDTANLPVDQFLAEVADHKFVLSPFGNGLDCYRNYEAMYLGSIPLIQDSVFASNLADLHLPFARIQSMILSPGSKESLEHTYEQVARSDFSYEPLTQSYWRQQIAESLS